MTVEDAIGPLITLSFLLALLAEARLPARPFPEVPRWRVLGGVFFLSSAGINIGLPLVLPQEWLRAHALLPGQRLGVGGGFLAGFLAWTLVYYWFHRLEHRFSLSWRFLHQLHHSAERVDAAGFAFAHPLDMVAQAVLSLLVLLGLLGLDPRAAALVGLYGALAALVQHLNLRTPAWLELVVQRPEAHLRHHEHGVHASNYADWPVWDRVFGTYRAPSPDAVKVGLGPGASGRLRDLLLGVDVSAGNASRNVAAP